MCNKKIFFLPVDHLLRLVYSQLIKAALAIESFLVNGVLPSGWNDDTLDKAILDGMWRHLNTSSPVYLEVDNGEDDEEAGAD
jgi:hypothetical protein